MEEIMLQKKFLLSAVFIAGMIIGLPTVEAGTGDGFIIEVAQSGMAEISATKWVVQQTIQPITEAIDAVRPIVLSGYASKEGKSFVDFLEITKNAPEFLQFPFDINIFEAATAERKALLEGISTIRNCVIAILPILQNAADADLQHSKASKTFVDQLKRLEDEREQSKLEEYLKIKYESHAPMEERISSIRELLDFRSSYEGHEIEKYMEERLFLNIRKMFDFGSSYKAQEIEEYDEKSHKLDEVTLSGAFGIAAMQREILKAETVVRSILDHSHELLSVSTKESSPFVDAINIFQLTPQELKAGLIAGFDRKIIQSAIADRGHLLEGLKAIFGELSSILPSLKNAADQNLFGAGAELMIEKSKEVIEEEE